MFCHIALGGGWKPLVGVLRQFRKGSDCEIQNHESEQSRTTVQSVIVQHFTKKGEYVLSEIVKEAICYFLISCLLKFVCLCKVLILQFANNFHSLSLAVKIYADLQQG